MEKDNQNIAVVEMELLKENIFFEDINEWDKYINNIDEKIII